MAKDSSIHDTGSDSDENSRPGQAEEYNADDESEEEPAAAAGSAAASIIPRIKEEPMNSDLQTSRNLFRKGDTVQVKPENEPGLLTDGYINLAKIVQDEEEDGDGGDGTVLIRWDWGGENEYVDRSRVSLVVDMTMEESMEGRRSRRARQQTSLYSQTKPPTERKKQGGKKSVAASSKRAARRSTDDNMKTSSLRKKRTAAKSAADKKSTQPKPRPEVKQEMPSPPRLAERAYEFHPNEKVKAKDGPKAFPTDATVVAIVDGETLMIRWEANQEEDEIDAAYVFKIVDLESGRGKRARNAPVTYSSQYVDSLVKKEEDSDDDGSTVPVQAKSNSPRMKQVARKSAGGLAPLQQLAQQRGRQPKQVALRAASAPTGSIVYKDDIESSSSSSEEKLDKDDEAYEAPRSYIKSLDDEEEEISSEEESDDSSTSVTVDHSEKPVKIGDDSKTQRKRGRPRKQPVHDGSSDRERLVLGAAERKRGRTHFYIASSSSSDDEEERKPPARDESRNWKQRKFAGQSVVRARNDDQEEYDSDMTVEFTSREVDPVHRNCHLFTSLEEFIGDEERNLASTLPPSPAFVKKAPMAANPTLPAAPPTSARVRVPGIPPAAIDASVAASTAIPTLNGHVRAPETPPKQRAALSAHHPEPSSQASDFSASPSLAFLNNLVHEEASSHHGRPSGETADTAAVADLLTDLSTAAAVP